MNGKRAKALRRASQPGPSRPAKRAYIYGRTSDAQQPKPAGKEHHHKRPDPAEPSWPRTKDQHAQSRPVIVLRPVRAARKEHERVEAEEAERIRLGMHVTGQLVSGA
jgi:hypothetical protein